MSIGVRRVLLLAMPVVALLAAGSASIHAKTPLFHRATQRTLPCVGVTVYVTQPPPWVEVCPPF